MAVVGIDLGTTNTVVAAVRDGRATALKDQLGRALLPSVVSFRPSASPLVGAEAQEQRSEHPEDTVFSIKRLIGRSWESSHVQTARSRFPFQLKEGPGKATLVSCAGADYTLPEVSAFVLEKARAVAEERLGETVTDVVITVPANFNDLQRAATKVAARVAGLQVLRIVNEPTAAALAYGFGKKGRERIAVYDFGGGTFDITLLDLSENVFEVLATAGDTFLGGDDIDLALFERMSSEFKKKHGIVIDEHPGLREKFRLAAEKLKVDLSTRSLAKARIDQIGHGLLGKPLSFEYALRRSELEQLIEPYIERTLAVCQEALEIAGLTTGDLDQVLLVGGSTRIPLVRRRISSFFGKMPQSRLNPDEVVAIGAAIQANALQAKGQSPSIPSPPEPPAPPRPASATSGTTKTGLAGLRKTLPGATGSEPPPPGLNSPPLRENSILSQLPHASARTTQPREARPPQDTLSGLGEEEKPRGPSTLLGVGKGEDLPAKKPALSPLRTLPGIQPSGPALDSNVTTTSTLSRLHTSPSPITTTSTLSSLGRLVSSPPPRTESVSTFLDEDDLEEITSIFPPNPTPSRATSTPSPADPLVEEEIDLPSPLEDSIALPAPVIKEAPTSPHSPTIQLSSALPQAPPSPLAHPPIEDGSVTFDLAELLEVEELAGAEHVLAPERKTTAQRQSATTTRLAARVQETDADEEILDLPASHRAEETAWPHELDLSLPSDSRSPHESSPELPQSESQNWEALDLSEDLPASIPPGPTAELPALPSLSVEEAHTFAPRFQEVDSDEFSEFEDFGAHSQEDPAPLSASWTTPEASDEEAPLPAPIPELPTRSVSSPERASLPSVPSQVDSKQTTALPLLQPSQVDSPAPRPLPPLQSVQAVGKAPAPPLPPPAPFTTREAPSLAREVPSPPQASPVQPLLIDVTPLSLGVEVVGGYVDALLERNTPIPCERTRHFITARDGQTTVHVRVCQGEQTRFEDNTLLGEVVLSGLSLDQRKRAQVQVTFALDESGLLAVSALDPQTGAEAKAELRLVGLQAS